MEVIGVIIALVIVGILFSVLRSYFRVKNFAAARDNPAVELFCTAVSAPGSYDATPQSKETAELIFQYFNNLEENSSTDLQQREYYWRLLEKYKGAFPMVLIAAFAVAYYCEANDFGINNRSSEVKIHGHSLIKIYPVLGDLANNENLTMALFNKTLLTIMPAMLLAWSDRVVQTASQIKAGAS